MHKWSGKYGSDNKYVLNREEERYHVYLDHRSRMRSVEAQNLLQLLVSKNPTWKANNARFYPGCASWSWFLEPHTLFGRVTSSLENTLVDVESSISLKTDATSLIHRSSFGRLWSLILTWHCWFSHKFNVLLLTFLSYASYHLARKPTSVVKNVLHYKNCSTAVYQNRDANPLDDNWCHWPPFGNYNIHRKTIKYLARRLIIAVFRMMNYCVMIQREGCFLLIARKS